MVDEKSSDSQFLEAAVWLILPPSLDQVQVDAIGSALGGTLPDDVPLLAVRRTGADEDAQPLGLVDKVAGAVLPGVVKDIWEAGTTVIRDSYNSEKKAREWYEERNRKWLENNDRHFGRA